MKSLRIGFSGAVSPGASVHGHTLQRAVAAALPWVESRWQVAIDPCWQDDGANADDAEAAARHLVAQGVCAVVGHYASSAAMGAAPVYAQHGIPLYLPAATATLLTAAPGVYRLCDNDADYCTYLKQVLRSAGHEHVGLAHDGSTHGLSVVNTLKAMSPQFQDATPADEVLLFAGTYARSRDFLARCAAHYPQARELVLCDDVMTPQARDDFAGTPLNVTIVGFCNAPRTVGEQALAARYTARWGGVPGVYFFETVSALEVAVSHLLDPEAAPDTAAGVLDLPRRALVREARPLRFAVLRLARAHSPDEHHVVGH